MHLECCNAGLSQEAKPVEIEASNQHRGQRSRCPLDHLNGDAFLSVEFRENIGSVGLRRNRNQRKRINTGCRIVVDIVFISFRYHEDLVFRFSTFIATLGEPAYSNHDLRLYFRNTLAVVPCVALLSFFYSVDTRFPLTLSIDCDLFFPPSQSDSRS